jgi:hypothetical protein
MILAENGSNWYISRMPSGHSSDDDLHGPGSLTAATNTSPVRS